MNKAWIAADIRRAEWGKSTRNDLNIDMPNTHTHTLVQPPLSVNNCTDSETGLAARAGYSVSPSCFRP